MKHERIISIKDKNLRKIRTNFRKLLLKELTHRYYILGSKKRSLNVDKNSNKIAIINSQISELNQLKRKSICYCRHCHRCDLDMQYSAEKDEWFCPYCYEIWVKNYPKHKEKFDQDYGYYEKVMRSLWDSSRTS